MPTILPKIPDDAVFRFRSIDRILSSELENLEIYFSRPDDLNDAMEGHTNFFWSGDEIVWTNLFKHYLAILLLEAIKASAKIDLQLNMTIAPNDMDADIFEEFKKSWDRFTTFGIKTYSKILGEKGYKINQLELETLFRVLHTTALASINPSLSSMSLPPLPISDYKKEDGLPDPVIYFHTKEYPQEKNDELFTMLNSFLEQPILAQTYQNRHIKIPEKVSLVLFDFPKEYVRSFKSIIFPDWVTASFIKDYSNSAMWGHYAQNHRGACLIFKPEIDNDKKRLQIKSITTKIDLNFTEVNYDGDYPEIDAFSNLGRLSQKALKEFWYNNGNGGYSSSGNNMLNMNDSLRKEYWESLPAMFSIKQSAWSYEQEMRLFLPDVVRDHYSHDANRLFKFSFKSLHGIIFGIRTSTQEKIRIIEIIESHCRRENHFDFSFYQAYYSKLHKCIRANHLSSLEFKK